MLAAEPVTQVGKKHIFMFEMLQYKKSQCVYCEKLKFDEV